MSVTVYIPTPYRALTGNLARVESHAADLAGLLDELERRFPGLKARVLDERGELHGFVSVFINNVEAEALGGFRAALHDGDEVALIPAIAGGQAAEKGRSAGYRRRTPPTRLRRVPAPSAPPRGPAGAHVLSVGSGLWTLLSGLVNRSHPAWLGRASEDKH